MEVLHSDADRNTEGTAKAVVEQPDIFREVKRVLKDDGTLWMKLGDSYHGGGRGGAAGFTYRRDKAPVSGLAIKHQIDGLKPKDLVGIPWMCAFSLRADGWYLRSDIIWHKPNPMPESVTDRPTKSHEYIFLMSKSQKYFYPADDLLSIVEIVDIHPLLLSKLCVYSDLNCCLVIFYGPSSPC